eukprot:15327860-Ditylum_brightwellii.AAC.1
MDSLCKQHEDESDQLDGVKQVCWDSIDGYDDHTDKLDDQIHNTLLLGAPLQKDSLATTTKGRRFSQTPD